MSLLEFESSALINTILICTPAPVADAPVALLTRRSPPAVPKALAALGAAVAVGGRMQSPGPQNRHRLCSSTVLSSRLQETSWMDSRGQQSNNLVQHCKNLKGDITIVFKTLYSSILPLFLCR